MSQLLYFRMMHKKYFFYVEILVTVNFCNMNAFFCIFIIVKSPGFPIYKSGHPKQDHKTTVFLIAVYGRVCWKSGKTCRRIWFCEIWRIYFIMEVGWSRVRIIDEGHKNKFLLTLKVIEPDEERRPGERTVWILL
mgnify:CR=1 FL=1